MKINSKNKGSRGERKIVNLFNENFDTTQFSRIPTSGAIGTVKSAELPQEALKYFCGDIITPKNFRFSIEIKNGYDVCLIKLLNGKNTKIPGFLDQIIKDAANTKLVPLLIYIKNRCSPVAVFPLEENLTDNDNFLIFEYREKKWILLDLEKLLKTASYNFWFTSDN